MNNVEVINEGGFTQIFVNGVELKKVTAVEFKQSAAEVPSFTFDMIANPKIKINDSDIVIRYHPQTVQSAAEVIRDELLLHSA